MSCPMRGPRKGRSWCTSFGRGVTHASPLVAAVFLEKLDRLVDRRRQGSFVAGLSIADHDPGQGLPGAGHDLAPQGRLVRGVRVLVEAAAVGALAVGSL